MLSASLSESDVGEFLDCQAPASGIPGGTDCVVERLFVTPNYADHLLGINWLVVHNRPPIKKGCATRRQLCDFDWLEGEGGGQGLHNNFDCGVATCF
jgi:hypothetical protein